MTKRSKLSKAIQLNFQSNISTYLKFVVDFVTTIEFSHSFRHTSSHFLQFSPSKHFSLFYLVPTPLIFSFNHCTYNNSGKITS
ncbi:hypothetical protein Hanom_Chr07g00612461 [Helianthus anomalus]